MRIKNCDLMAVIDLAIKETRYGGDLETMQDNALAEARVYLGRKGYPLQRIRRAYVELKEDEMWKERCHEVENYLYANFKCSIGNHPTDELSSVVWITGFDHLGFTMEAQVDRLASGLIVAKILE